EEHRLRAHRLVRLGTWPVGSGLPRFADPGTHLVVPSLLPVPPPTSAGSGSAWSRANTSGWCRSKAGRSERTRGRVTKLCRGGGQEVANSRELPCPQGSSTVTFGACRQVLYTFHKNGSVRSAE